MSDSKPPLTPVSPASYGTSPSVTDIAPATATPPESQLAREEAAKEEVENRRARLASDLLEQKHGFIGNAGGMILSVIVALYLIFGMTIGSLLLSGRAFSDEIPITAMVLIGMCGSVPTILSISLLVGLFAKEKDHGKDEKSLLDSSLIAKVCFEVIKYMKAPH